MLGLAGKSTGNRHRRGHRSVSVQIVFTGLTYLAAGYEVRAIKLFEDNVNLWLMQHPGVSSPNSFTQLRQGLPLCVHLLLQSLQSNEAIRLDSDRLVELRSKSEADFHPIAGA